jgi:hypothetical protein
MDDGDTSLFFSGDKDDKPKCFKKKGESCSIKGKPLPGDPKKLDCCAQPEYNKANERWEIDGAQARDGNDAYIKQFSDGEMKCKMDFHTQLAPTQGICVYKKTGRP